MIINKKEDLENLQKIKNLMDYYNKIKNFITVLKFEINKEKCVQYNFYLSYLKSFWNSHLTILENNLENNNRFLEITKIIKLKLNSFVDFNAENIDSNLHFKDFEFIENLFKILYKEDYPEGLFHN